MDPFYVSMPRAVEQTTKDFLSSSLKSELEKISVATLAALARVARDVAVPDHQDLMIGTTIEKFFRETHEEIAQRANGQMGDLEKSFSILSGASYGKNNFHESVRIILREQAKLVEKISKEEPKNIAYGVMQHLLNLVRDTKTEKEADQVQELLKKVAPDDDCWQEMLKTK